MGELGAESFCCAIGAFVDGIGADSESGGDFSHRERAVKAQDEGLAILGREGCEGIV